MPGEADVAQRRAGVRVHEPQRTLAVADDDRPGCGVETDVVRVIERVDTLEYGKRATLHEVEPAALTVCDVEAIRLRHIGEALRFLEAAETALVPISGDVEHLDRVVAERGDEQALALQVDREVIDATIDARHFDGGDQLKRLRESRCHCGQAGNERRYRQPCGFHVYSRLYANAHVSP